MPHRPNYRGISVDARKSATSFRYLNLPGRSWRGGGKLGKLLTAEMARLAASNICVERVAG